MAGAIGKRAMLALLAGVIATTAIALAPDPASAARKVITRSETGSAGADQLAEATATCPPGSALVGGGYSSVPDPNPVIVQTSRRVGARSWLVKGLRENAPAELTSYAYCRRGAARPRQFRTTTPITAGTSFQTETATARCPVGRRAVAGGFEVGVDFSEPSSPDGVFVSASARSGRRSWSVVGTHGHDNQTLDLTSYVYCSKRKRGKRVDTAPVAGPSAVTRETPPCRRTALSGGFRSNPVDFEGDDNAVLVVESRRVGKSWRNVGQNLGTTATATMTTFAYCG